MKQNWIWVNSWSSFGTEFRTPTPTTIWMTMFSSTPTNYINLCTLFIESSAKEAVLLILSGNFLSPQLNPLSIILDNIAYAIAKNVLVLAKSLSILQPSSVQLFFLECGDQNWQNAQVAVKIALYTVSAKHSLLLHSMAYKITHPQNLLTIC